MRVHDLRHTAASLWLAAGADPKVVQRVLGHATAAMTMDLYGHSMSGASPPPEAGIRTEREAGRDANNPYELGFRGGAAYRNRTDDLRITRSPRPRSGRATCTDSSTRVPECSQRTVCSGLPVHDPVHGVGQPSVTECYWMVLMALARGHRVAGAPNAHAGPGKHSARADQDMRTRLTPNLLWTSVACTGQP